MRPWGTRPSCCLDCRDQIRGQPAASPRPDDLLDRCMVAWGMREEGEGSELKVSNYVKFTINTFFTYNISSVCFLKMLWIALLISVRTSAVDPCYSSVWACVSVSEWVCKFTIGCQPERGIPLLVLDVHVCSLSQNEVHESGQRHFNTSTSDLPQVSTLHTLHYILYV